MFRKLALALVAVATLSAPAFAIGPHFGGGNGGGGGGGVGPHFGGGHPHAGGGFIGGGRVVIIGAGSCWRTVLTSFGPRRVFVCD